MQTALFTLLLLSVLTFGLGCTPPPQVAPPLLPVLAQVPVPTAYPLKTQPKMQAIQHWEVLAEDVAVRVHEVLERRVVQRQFPVHVAPSGTTPFAKSFHALLITKLVQRGIPVSNDLTESMVLSFDIDLIHHGNRIIRTEKGMYTSLSPDVSVQRNSLTNLDGHGVVTNQALLNAAQADVDAGMFTFVLPRVEVMITSTLLYADSYLMRDSSIYYVNDSEWWHYRQHVVPGHPSVVNYELVDR